MQVEARAKRAQMDANKALSVEGENLANANRDLQDRLEKAEQERMRMEARHVIVESNCRNGREGVPIIRTFKISRDW